MGGAPTAVVNSEGRIVSVAVVAAAITEVVAIDVVAVDV
eukprot:CAMPEP_0180808746 /NCGR_PEP_ID=MMETSP1038_2-20121128/63957_1 /TAXON_ID=632150 /ORGANISM="Azadinium spinosum, Strain 3D9" /LENGTH=38 /DNA_ID= /DNA_START= /DNA_END= /DNA_ORIENTATION=